MSRFARRRSLPFPARSPASIFRECPLEARVGSSPSKLRKVDAECLWLVAPAGLTEESHIQGVGMVMATPRLHYDPRPVPAPPKSGPADTRLNHAAPHKLLCCIFAVLQASQEICKRSNANGSQILRRGMRHNLPFRYDKVQSEAVQGSCSAAAACSESKHYTGWSLD